jgi:hypothetical protein
VIRYGDRDIPCNAVTTDAVTHVTIRNGMKKYCIRLTTKPHATMRKPRRLPMNCLKAACVTYSLS